MNRTEYKARIEELRPLEVASYLRAAGWIQSESREGRYAIWTRDDEYEVLLPLSRDLRDFALRMGDLLAVLSQVEDRFQNSILSDLLDPPLVAEQRKEPK